MIKDRPTLRLNKNNVVQINPDAFELQFEELAANAQSMCIVTVSKAGVPRVLLPIGEIQDIEKLICAARDCVYELEERRFIALGDEC